MSALFAAGTSDTHTRLVHYCRLFLWEQTGLVYQKPVNTAEGMAQIESAENVRRGFVKDRELPWGYGSGIEDVNLLGGQLLFSLCNAWEKNGNPALADYIRKLGRGFLLIAEVSPEKGFVPRGPHPDGKSYYTDPSMDQVTAHIYALWRYYHCSLAEEKHKEIIRRRIPEVMERLIGHNWEIMREDGKTRAYVGHSWLGFETHAVISLLMGLAAAWDVSGNEKWLVLFRDLSAERWKYLDPAWEFHFSGHQLYIYQKQYQLLTLRVILEKMHDLPHVKTVEAALAGWGEGMLASTWPQKPADWPEDEIRQLGWKTKKVTPREGWMLYEKKMFDPVFRQERSINNKALRIFIVTCVRFPAANFLGACLSGDAKQQEIIFPLFNNMLKAVDFTKDIDNGDIVLLSVLYDLYCAGRI
ncbi:MAG: hypothetical protein A2096_00190 [Spirochaetes bacterium GWF1_41_5]|nr:MAG: hypothetical protein A2096_00190 [Spirochaetes bacterium GWF1_41_5]